MTFFECSFTKAKATKADVCEEEISFFTRGYARDPHKTIDAKLMAACITIKRAIFDAPQKIGKGFRIFFIFGKSQIDHNSKLYLKQL